MTSNDLGPVIEKQFGMPSHTIAHISDTHFVGEGGLLRGRVDCEQQLDQLLKALAASDRRPNALVFTGDLADEGRESAYVRLRELVEPAAADLGATVIWVMGNHDAREPFRRHLLGSDPSSASVDFVETIAGLRIVVLDTSVPGFHHGELSDDQLDWLSEQLEQPAEAGTIVAMHHPPIPTRMELLEVYELMEQHRLQSVLAGTDVRAILAGHFHYSSFSTIAGIPVSVASATCYTQDLIAPAGGVRGIDGGRAFNLVDVYEDRIVHSILPLDVPATLYEKTRALARGQMVEVDRVRRGGSPRERDDQPAGHGAAERSTAWDQIRVISSQI